ncbi:MAG: adenylyl-sulfate kinase, partial [Bacteroidetes bacterium]|nr:adenylyl-sulfate kinase [Bacteroidota bacterium]
FIGVFVNAPVSVCEQRDVKGLYKKARAGEIKNFTGVDTVFEPMANADIEVRTDKMSAADAVEKIMHYVLPYISMQDNKE